MRAATKKVLSTEAAVSTKPNQLTISRGIIPSSKPILVRQFLTKTLVFLVGLIGIDQTLLRVGDRLVASQYWSDNLAAHVAASDDWDLLITGTCRAWNVRTPTLEEQIGKKVLNAGVRTSRIPTLAFQINLAAARNRNKPVLMFMDYWELSPTPELVRQELDSQMLYFSYLSKEAQQHLIEVTRLPSWALIGAKSGLWKYKGQGNLLLRAVLRAIRGIDAPKDMPRPVGTDRFNWAENIVMNERTDDFRVPPVETREVNSLGLSIAESSIRDALNAGLKPILIIPPMHRSHATKEVNEMTVSEIIKLGKRYDLRVVNYLDNDGEFAKKDEYWANPEHLNGKGAAAFTRQLATDLKAILP